MRLSTLTLPITAGPGGTLATVAGSDRVMQGVTLFFMTRKGSRALVPEFGTPPLPRYPEEIPAWNAEVESGLLLVSGIAGARLQTTLDSSGRLKGRARIRTDGQEELDYDITINPYA